MARAARAGSRWYARLRQTAFYDYHDQAFQLWAVLFTAGAAVAGWAVVEVIRDPSNLAGAVAAMCLSALAAHMPIRLPRATISVSLSDMVVLGALVLFGLPAACLAAVAEAVVASWKTSTRVSSRLLSPAIGAGSMLLAGLIYKALTSVGAGAELRPEATLMAALAAAAFVNYLMSTGMFSAFVAVKRDLHLSVREFFGTTAWIGAVQVSSAVITGMGVLIAQIFGILTLSVLACATVGIALLVRRSVLRNEEERLQSEAQIAEARREAELNYQRFMASFTHAAVGMAITRTDGTTLRVNQSVCHLVRRSEDQLVGTQFEDLFEPDDLAPHRDALREIQHSRISAVSMEVRLRSVTGHETWASVHCSSFDDPADGGTCLIFQLHDITARRAAESKLAHIAYHDSLTDVANRAWFDKQLTEAVESCTHNPEVRFAVVMLDLDRFKIVNDSLGHAAGNLLLVEVAKRLKACVRPSDLVARLGGDEFALILRSVTFKEIFGGSDGRQAFADGFFALSPYPDDAAITIGPAVVNDQQLWTYTVGWALVALALLITWLLVRSPWGRVVKGIREDEDAVRSLGKNVFTYKMQALVLGGIFGALAGFITAIGAQNVNPDVFKTDATFFAYAILILGGAARVFGPLLGTIIFWALFQGTDVFLREGIDAGLPIISLMDGTQAAVLRVMLVGLGIMLLMIYRPQGILGDRKELALDAR